MGITISNTEIKVTNNEYSFEDIYQYAVDNNKTSYVKKLGNSYEITVDLRIKDNGTVSDINKTITILGDLIQIHSGSTLKLGEKRANGSTLNGCTIIAPNIKNSYGFGCTTKTDSGNLFLYNSTADIYGFWGFFSGTNHVEIIDCMINGYGRIEGSNSILKNIIFKTSNGKFGILSPKGELAEMSNLSVYDSTIYSGFKCSVYHNPEYANDLKIIGGTYDGYNKLAYIEENSGGNSLTFLDSEIKSGYELERESNNIDFFHKYTFSPICRDANGNTISGVKVLCVDKNGDIVFDSVSGFDGSINEEVIYYSSDRNERVEEIKTPHTFSFSYDDISFDRTIYIDKPMKGIPLYIVSEGIGSGSDSCDYNLIQDKLDALQLSICGCVTDSTSDIGNKLESIESGIKQVVREVSDEVNENQTVLEKTGFKVIV